MLPSECFANFLIPQVTRRGHHILQSKTPKLLQTNLSRPQKQTRSQRRNPSNLVAMPASHAASMCTSWFFLFMNDLTVALFSFFRNASNSLSCPGLLAVSQRWSLIRRQSMEPSLLVVIWMLSCLVSSSLLSQQTPESYFLIWEMPFVPVLNMPIVPVLNMWSLEHDQFWLSLDDVNVLNEHVIWEWQSLLSSELVPLYYSHLLSLCSACFMLYAILTLDTSANVIALRVTTFLRVSLIAHHLLTCRVLNWKHAEDLLKICSNPSERTILTRRNC